MYFRTEFSTIDNKPITPFEIFNAYISVEKPRRSFNQDQFKFDLAIRRRTPNMDLTNLSELDFSDCGFEKIDLIQFPNLQKLSLANNSLKDTTLVSSNIHKLIYLRELDVRNNKIKEISTLVKIVNQLPHIESVWYLNNPMCKEERRVSISTNSPKLTFLVKVEKMADPEYPLKNVNSEMITNEERFLVAQKLNVSGDFSYSYYYHL